MLPSGETASTVPGDVMSVREMANVLTALSTIRPDELPI
jgi:hypothetical protein